MNCESFRDIVGDLANYQLMDVGTRDEARAHGVICRSCANELNRVQTASQLLDIALAAESEQAPSRVKQALLGAFHNHSQLATQHLTVASGKFGWWIPAAAAVLLFAVVVISRVSSTSTTSTTTGVSETQQTPVAGYSPLPAASPNDSSLSASAISSEPGHIVKPVNRRQRSLTARKETIPSNNVAKTASSTYVPLTYLSSSTAMESGTVVRVELSRATLLSLGVPVNIDRSTEHFKADLVIGDDGVIRALRLVE